MMHSTVYFNPVYQAVNETKKRYRILFGSAGSGKSVNVCQDYILKLSDRKYKGANLLVVRKINESNRNSTFAELCSAIHRIFGAQTDRYWKINNTTLQITSLITGNEVIFRGMKDDNEREKIKSVTFRKGKLTWIWVEEATELQADDVEQLDDRLRGRLDNKNLYYQITLTFNPVSASHWIKKRYFDISSDDVFSIKTTYKDNLFIDKAYYRRMDRLKEIDYNRWLVYACGNWGNTEGLIFRNNFEVVQCNQDINYYDKVVYGIDWGYNHASAILKIGMKDCTVHGGDIYVLSEIYLKEKDTAEIIEIMNQRKTDKHLLIYAESAEPDRNKMLRKAGYRVYPVKKGAGSVLAQIDILQKMKIHIDNSCTNTLKEIQSYHWYKNTQTNEYEDRPVEIMDDAIAALRYGIEPVRTENKEIQASYVDY